MKLAVNIRSTLLRGIACSFLLSILPLPASALVPGAKISDLKMSDVEGTSISLGQFKGKPIVLEWTNIECPFANEQYASGNIAAAQKAAKEKGALWITVDSTNASHRNYHKAIEVKEYISEHHAAPDYLIKDEDGKVGQYFGAKTTPHLFVVDAQGTLVYEGAIDDQPKLESDHAKAKNYVLTALDALRESKPVEPAEVDPYGCSVKY